jgi:glycerol transport system ATP-binding protein
VARIDLIDLAHSYGTTTEGESASWALQPMTVTWRDGGAYALLGPSGCGKTTLLNIVSGLVTPSRGKVLFDGIDVTQLPPQARNIAQVFQFPVIYDTMSVFDNLAFPLRNRKWKNADILKRVQEVAELLDLTQDLKRRASGLTADAKQKISLGRGLVRPDVAAVLFDEPLTVIDPHLKWLLRRKLKQIHQQLGISLIYVTHDQTEALTFADTIVVMTSGTIAQSGTAEQLFNAPEHTFVGHFIGNPGMNFLPCKLDSTSAQVDSHLFSIDSSVLARAMTSQGPYKLGIRPEFIEISTSAQPGANQIIVESAQSMGAYMLVSARLGEHALWIKVAHDAHVPLGPAWMRVPDDRILIYADERRVQ